MLELAETLETNYLDPPHFGALGWKFLEDRTHVSLHIQCPGGFSL